MKKRFIFLFFALNIFSTATFFAKDFSIDIEPQFGIRYGILGEYVYGTSYSTRKDYILSYLEWDIKPAMYAGLKLDLGLKKFHLEGSWKQLIPNFSGRLQDSDWLQDAGYRTGNTTLKTNYSNHDNHIDNGFSLCFSARYDININPTFTLSPLVEFSYAETKFTGSNGYGFYGYGKNDQPFSENNPSYYGYNNVNHRSTLDFTGYSVISYLRKDYFAWTGVNAKFSTRDQKFIFSIAVLFSPFAYCYAQDYHILRDTYFIDMCAGLIYGGKFKSFIQYNFSKNFGLKLTVDGLFTGRLRGPDYKRGPTDTSYRLAGKNIGGASTAYFDIQLSALLMF